ncbi:unnamed protein product [Discosporangium mesarthrocarpum]
MPCSMHLRVAAVVTRQARFPSCVWAGRIFCADARTRQSRWKGTSAASIPPPLVLQYKDGKYKLAVALSSDVETKETAFSFGPDLSLARVKASIEEEGAEQVEFLGSDGTPLTGDMTLGEITRAAGEEGGLSTIKIDQRQFPVLTTWSGGYAGEGGGEEEGMLSLPSLVERGRVIRLREVLQEDGRRSVPYDEFERLCQDHCGMDAVDARKVRQNTCHGSLSWSPDMMEGLLI